MRTTACVCMLYLVHRGNFNVERFGDLHKFSGVLGQHNILMNTFLAKGTQSPSVFPIRGASRCAQYGLDLLYIWSRGR